MQPESNDDGSMSDINEQPILDADDEITIGDAARFRCKCDACHREPDSNTYWPNAGMKDNWKLHIQTGDLIFQHTADSSTFPWFHRPGNNPYVVYFGYAGVSPTRNAQRSIGCDLEGALSYCKICEVEGHCDEDCEHYESRFRPRERRNSSSGSEESDGLDVSPQPPPPKRLKRLPAPLQAPAQNPSQARDCSRNE